MESQAAVSVKPGQKDEPSSLFTHSHREGSGGYSIEKDWVRALQKGVVNFTKYEELVEQMRAKYMGFDKGQKH